MKYYQKIGWFFIIPSIIGFLGVILIPLIRGIYLGFTNYNLLKINEVRFIGFNNFIDILLHNPDFWKTSGFTLIFVMGTVSVSYLFGMLIAYLLNKDIKGRGFYRALLLIPWVIPTVVSAFSWRWIMNDQVGIINIFLKNIGIIKKPLLFLADANMAKLTVIMVNSWKSFPFMTLVLLSGMQSIPNELYEAAELDGTNWFKSFIYITLPNLKGVSFIATILLFIWTFNNFETIYLLTMGGPANATRVLSILTYVVGFSSFKLGYASSISTIMMVFMTIIAIFYLRLLKVD